MENLRLISQNKSLEFEKEKFIAIASLSQSILYFIVYLSMVIYVKISVKPNRFDTQSLITIITFLTCQLLNILVKSLYWNFLVKEHIYLDDQS